VNSVQRLREAQLLGKAEFARRAGVSESTIDRVEAGQGCRMETKRKILFALGLTLSDGPKVFKKDTQHHKGAQSLKKENGRPMR